MEQTICATSVRNGHDQGGNSIRQLPQHALELTVTLEVMVALLVSIGFDDCAHFQAEGVTRAVGALHRPESSGMQEQCHNCKTTCVSLSLQSAADAGLMHQ